MGDVGHNRCARMITSSFFAVSQVVRRVQLNVWSDAVDVFHEAALIDSIIRLSHVPQAVFHVSVGRHRMILGVDLSMVEVVEVGDDHRDGKCYRQHAGDSTHRPDDFSPLARWMHVAVADRRHRHDGPPERMRDGIKVGLDLPTGLGEVNRTREQDHTDEEEEDQQPELPHASVDRLPEDLQSFWVPWQLENSKDADQSDDTKHGERHGLVVGLSLFLREKSTESYEVRYDCEQVDNVHDVAEESEVIGAGGKPNYQFWREPDDARRFDNEERIILARSVVFDEHFGNTQLATVGSWIWDVSRVKVTELWEGFKAENNNWQKDDHYRQQRNQPCSHRALWIFNQQPNLHTL